MDEKQLLSIAQQAESEGDLDTATEAYEMISQLKRSQVTAGSQAKELGTTALGMGEVGLNLLTSAAAEPIAGLTGLAHLGKQGLSQGLESIGLDNAAQFVAPNGTAASEVEATRQALTYDPRGARGQDYQQSLGQSLQPLGEAFQEAEQGIGDVVYDATGSPTAAALATTIPTAGLEAATLGLAKGAGTLAKKASNVKGTDIPQDLQDAFKHGQVLTSDVYPPQTFIGKSLQKLGERVPYAGTGNVRASQQLGRQDAVKSFAADFDVVADAPYEQVIVGEANTTFKESRRRASKLRKEAVTELDTGGGVDTVNTRSIIEEEISKQKALGKKADQNLIDSLEDTLASLEGNFSHVTNIRTAVLNEITDIGGQKSPIRSGGDAVLERVRGGLSRDLNSAAEQFAKQADSREGALAAKKWKASNRLFADGFKKAKDTELKRLLTKGEVTPEIVGSIIRGGKKSELSRLYEYSGAKGREATRQFIIQEAIEKSGGIDNLNPTQLLNKLNNKNTRTATNMFFRGGALRELDGLKKYLELTRRAQEANVATPTGQEAVTIGAAVAAGFEPTIVLPVMAVAGGGARLFESGTVRNLMIKLRNAKSPAEQMKLYNQIKPLLVLGANKPETSENQ